VKVLDRNFERQPANEEELGGNMRTIRSRFVVFCVDLAFSTVIVATGYSASGSVA
jgi:hypothetical protein